ncbi:S41 family peptidase [Flavobacterium piscisymbiosum]|uniref:S41 family peptidase n=1 Tax=Flavobacterium piscisymbiosum TaxID=2893753 RepID=A0ABS8MIB2_9FLAO|nr:S41 family peptidase [Flavobacterium sp. F-30]MCC9065232.1 S41 family peptidase [Flavobacterium sp. F-30]
MNLKKTVIFLFLIISFNTFAQKCSCQDNFAWLKQTFEENDAGFQFVIDKKGLKEYQNHNEIFSKKIKNIKDANDCQKALSEWLLFFRKSHLSLVVNQDQQKKEAAKPNTAANDKWEKMEIPETELKNNLAKNSLPGFEGIWVSEPYTIGVVKKDNQYVGYILDAKGTKWKQYQVKFKITENLDKTHTAIYYLGDYSSRKFDDIQFIGNNFLKIGFVSLKRVFPNIQENNPEISDYIESITTQEPFIKAISPKTVLLRIPSFNYSNKKAIDSILAANHNLITSRENLIIDLRDNGGGSDSSFENIIPYLYSNPIRNIGVQFLSTKLNNKRMEDFMADPEWSDKDKEWARKGLEKLNAHLGQFVNLEENAVEETKLDKVLTNPKNIGIIIHENNASTTEQFLLAAKQSKKVKLFGTTTEGVLDISNMYFIDSPCKDLKLGYSLSKSFRIPGMQIDDKGIQPDYYLDKTIPEYNWVRFTEQILNAN